MKWKDDVICCGPKSLWATRTWWFLWQWGRRHLPTSSGLRCYHIAQDVSPVSCPHQQWSLPISSVTCPIRLGLKAVDCSFSHLLSMWFWITFLSSLNFLIYKMGTLIPLLSLWILYYQMYANHYHSPQPIAQIVSILPPFCLTGLGTWEVLNKFT